jgi:ABC-type dipeptide/oligopeptide/nickel transport system permease subunit
MHRRLFGLSCTLAVLIAGYVIGWFADRVMHGFTDSYTFSFFLLALLLATIFTLAVLFLVVLPQALLVRWFTRRFQLRGATPFLLFLLLSSAVLLALAFLPNVKRLPLLLVGTPYLVAACSVLWCISFHDNAV